MTAPYAQESGKSTPLEAYKGDTFVASVICQAKLLSALARGDLYQPPDRDSDVHACIADGKTLAKASLDKALRTLRKPKAKEALKEYHIAFVTALEGLKPGTQEPRFAYEQRQQSLKSKMTEAWTRFELEQ